MKRKASCCTKGTTLLGGALAALYVWKVRPWMATWGTECDEASRPSPGDVAASRPSRCLGSTEHRRRSLEFAAEALEQLLPVFGRGIRGVAQDSVGRHRCQAIAGEHVSDLGEPRRAPGFRQLQSNPFGVQVQHE